jgi:hypothetical protein
MLLQFCETLASKATSTESFQIRCDKWMLQWVLLLFVF